MSALVVAEEINSFNADGPVISVSCSIGGVANATPSPIVS